MLRIIEDPSGVGQVFEGSTHIAEVSYSLTILQESSGLQSISGELEVLEGKFFLMGRNVLTLYLDDGRLLDFFVTHQTPPNNVCQIQATGTFRST